MTEKELMIGDWVLYGQRFAVIKELYNGYVTILCSINGQNEYVEETYDNIDPIPLTLEILKKNKLNININNSYTNILGYFDEDENNLLEIYIEEDEIWWSISYAEYTILRLRYVHELQHALKLCGIKKEIEL